MFLTELSCQNVRWIFQKSEYVTWILAEEGTDGATLSNSVKKTVNGFKMYWKTISVTVFVLCNPGIFYYFLLTLQSFCVLCSSVLMSVKKSFLTVSLSSCLPPAYVYTSGLWSICHGGFCAKLLERSSGVSSWFYTNGW